MVECPLVRVRSLFFHINRSMFVGIASALAIKASPVAPENRPLDVEHCVYIDWIDSATPPWHGAHVGESLRDSATCEPCCRVPRSWSLRRSLRQGRVFSVSIKTKLAQSGLPSTEVHGRAIFVSQIQMQHDLVEDSPARSFLRTMNGNPCGESSRKSRFPNNHLRSANSWP